ncbi:MAG: tRNA glutamyl-Q(34) synthetase GluQRS [Pseudomonadota bacterium]
MNAFVTRFAPSPTYYLHLGHAASALQVWRQAEIAGGQVLLRIEDIDTSRCRPEYVSAIFEDLAWLGLTWPTPVRVQSDHFEAYAACVEALAGRGLVYRCFRTRAELAQLADPLRPGPHVPIDEYERCQRGDPFAWRLSLSAAERALGPAVWADLAFRELTPEGVRARSAEPGRLGDIVLARKDSPSAYHLAATHDDALQGVTHVIRGEDLIDAPHIQTLLQVLLDWPQPIYQHHPLVTDEMGQKLSKREKSPTLANLRAAGISADQIKQQLGFG